MVKGGNESKRRMRTRKVMAFHQVLGQKKVADRRQNGREQNANGGFALVEQVAPKAKGESGVASRPRIAQLENHRRPRNRYQRADLLGRDRALPCIKR